MNNIITITLPANISPQDAEDIQNSLNQINAVEDTGTASARAVDPAIGMAVWMQLATGILGVVGAALPVTQKILEIFQKKKISGAKIELPDGTEISLDNADPEKIAKLLEAVKKQ